MCVIPALRIPRHSRKSAVTHRRMGRSLSRIGHDGIRLAPLRSIRICVDHHHILPRRSENELSVHHRIGSWNRYILPETECVPGILHNTSLQRGV